MIAVIMGFGSIGLFYGFMFTIFYINFDSKWKLLLEGLIGIGGSGMTLWYLFTIFDIQDSKQKLVATASFTISFFLTIMLALMILCKVIKDKNNADILGIRDILLGQKSYIEKYYEQRKKEIDSNISKLLEKEKELNQLEKELTTKSSYIISEMNKLEQIGDRKLKFVLPIKKDIYITQELIELLPSYISDITTCIHDIKLYTNDFLKNNDIKKIELENFESYLLSISTYIAQDIFGGKPDIRVHFRYFDRKTKKYETLVTIMGKEIVTKKMTSIPYKNSMIQKSFECKRALIKSINWEFDYKSDNSTLWKDYMTYAFYNLKQDNIPYLTFGISTKNEARFKNLFYFLNLKNIWNTV